MKDTLEFIPNNLTLDYLEIVTKVESFYNSAWDKLLYFVSATAFVVGIVLPLVIQWYQKRNLKLREQQLKSDLETSLFDELEKKIDEKFTKYQQTILNLNSQILFSQAKLSLGNSAYKSALGELVSASKHALDCENYAKLLEILKVISTECISSLTQEEINDLRIAGVCDITVFLVEITEKDRAKLCESLIGDIRLKISKLPADIAKKVDNKS